jgi:gliding motility-associated-like protein
VLHKDLVCFDDGQTTTLTASTTAKDNQKATFQWFYAGTVVGSGETLQINQSGDYSVIAQYEQCQLKGAITVQNNCTGIIYAPTAFSPNKDGLNDVLKIWGKRFKDLEIQIYDQWGTEIFASLLPDEQGFATWDGTHKGVELPTGTYVLTMKYLDLGTLLITKKQQGVTIIR